MVDRKPSFVNVGANHTELVNSIHFIPTLGAECSLAAQGKALLIVHAGSLNERNRYQEDQVYQDYLVSVENKKKESLGSGGIVIQASMRLAWGSKVPFDPEENVVHLVTLNGHGKMADEFICNDVTYTQNMVSLSEFLRQKKVQNVEVIGEFGSGCASEMRDLFAKHEFKAVMGKELFD